MVVYSGVSLPATTTDQYLFATNIASVYSGTSLTNNAQIQPYILASQSSDTEKLMSLGQSATINWLGGNIGIAPTDPYWNNTVAVLHMDGINGSTEFIDQKGRVVTMTGTPMISTAQYHFGGASGYFGGAAGNSVNLTQNTDFEFGLGDFTVE